jgi:orotidine-5'-phosphate decarboxylase
MSAAVNQKKKRASIVSPEIILALDVETPALAKDFVERLYPQIRIYKVGLQLFTAAGPAIVEHLRKKGAEVFLDLKLFDIPNTVARAAVEAAKLDIAMMTLHIAGGQDMLKATAQSIKALKAQARKPLLLGVTVLTSQHTQSGTVLALAGQAGKSGLDGIVCSVHEAAGVRRKFGKTLKIVTPGIRSAFAPADDQKRTATITDAVQAGSDFLVIGRPILQAAQPVKAAETMLRELDEARLC